MQCRRPGFDPWVGKIPWRRKRLSTPVFWPGEFHGLCSPWSHKESDITDWFSLSLFFQSVLFSSIAQSCLSLGDTIDYSIPGFPVHHQLPEFTHTNVHWVGDAIQPSHPLIPFSSCLQSFPESGSFPKSQFSPSGGQSIGFSASLLPMNIQDWFPLGWAGWISINP